jgi:hypothetical protein
MYSFTDNSIIVPGGNVSLNAGFLLSILKIKKGHTNFLVALLQAMIVVATRSFHP